MSACLDDIGLDVLCSLEGLNFQHIYEDAALSSNLIKILRLGLLLTYQPRGSDKLISAGTFDTISICIQPKI